MIRFMVIFLILAGCAGKVENETKARALYCLGFCLEVEAESESEAVKHKTELEEEEDEQ